MKISFKERIKNELSLSRVFPILDISIKEFNSGATLVSKKSYLNWIYKKMEQENWRDINPCPKTASVIKWANELIEFPEEEWCDSSEDSEVHPRIQRGYDLMYRVIIEPFYEIYKEIGDEKYAKTNDFERNL